MHENSLQKEIEIKRWKAVIPAFIGLGVIYYLCSEEIKSGGLGAESGALPFSSYPLSL